MPPQGSARVSVPFVASDFPVLAALNGPGSLDVSWNDVLWALVTVGRAQKDLMRSGRYSYAEVLHRVACLCAYYDIQGNRLVLSPAFDWLDATEKGVVSFYIGMAMAKLYADRVLAIPYMMHISRYEADWAVTYGEIRDRPDLFGCNAQGQWAVAEAKGRVRVTAKLVDKMARQKGAVASIQGVTPTHRYGSATRFDGKSLALRVVDPPLRGRGEDLPIDPGIWLLDYYRPIVDMLEPAALRQEGPSFFGALPGTEIEVGIPGLIVEEVRASRERRPRPARPRPAPPIDGEDLPRPLTEQTEDADLRSVVQRLTVAARVATSMDEANSDGLIVRSLRR